VFAFFLGSLAAKNAEIAGVYKFPRQIGLMTCQLFPRIPSSEKDVGPAK